MQFLKKVVAAPSAIAKAVVRPFTGEDGKQGKVTLVAMKLEKVYYFPAKRGRAEPLELLLNYTQTPYELVQLTFAQYGEMRSAGKFPGMQGLPVVEFEGGKKLAQSGSITRLVATLTDTVPKDPWEAAVCDSIHEMAYELVDANLAIHAWKDDMLRDKVKGLFKQLDERLDALKKYLGDKSFFMGAKPMYCDFTVYHYLSQLMFFKASVLSGHKALQDWYARVEALPGIKEYLAKREPHSVERVPMLKAVGAELGL